MNMTLSGDSSTIVVTHIFGSNTSSMFVLNMATNDSTSHMSNPASTYEDGKVGCVVTINNDGTEALQGKRDTLEYDVIIGGLLSFSPIVIFVV